MAELIEIGEQQERVILFAASTNASDDTEESVEELRELVKTAGAETVGAVIQNRENIHPGTYLGKGKIQELKEKSASLEHWQLHLHLLLEPVTLLVWELPFIWEAQVQFSGAG